MKILIKFDYENKTYYVYQEDNSIKYGTSENIKYISDSDKNVIIYVINLLRPSKYLIKLTPFIFNGKKFDIYLDTKTKFKLFNPLPNDDEIVKFNSIFNDFPFEFNIEFNDKEKKFIRKTINYGKKTIIVFVAAATMLTNLSFFPNIVRELKIDSYTTHMQEVTSSNKNISDEEFLSKINKAITNNNNLSNEEKIFMISNSFFFLDNKEYINFESLINRLKSIRIEYSPLESNEKIEGQYQRIKNVIYIYKSPNFESTNPVVLAHEFMHACQDFGPTNYNSFLVETVNNITTSEYYELDGSYLNYVNYARALMEILGGEPFKEFQCYPKEGLIVNELSKIIDSHTKAIKLLNDLDNYKSLTLNVDVYDNESVKLLKEEIYNSIKDYYETKFHRNMEDDLIMLYYLNQDLFISKIKEEYGLEDEYNIVYVKNKFYLNSISTNSNENNLIIVIDKKNSEISEPINIELNDLNRVIKNKLVK